MTSGQATSRMMVRRRTWRRLHLWLALSLGAVIALLGLTGAALVMKGPLFRWETGRIIAAPGPVSPGSWIATARTAQPDLVRVMGISAPRAGFLPTDAATVYGPTAAGGFSIVLIDPATARPLGVIAYDDTLFSIVVDLHRRLLLPPPWGSIAGTIAGGGLILSTVSGLWLWWPRAPRQFRLPRLTRAAQGRRRVQELHDTSGVWLALPMLVVAITGAMLAWPLGGPPGPSRPTGPATICRASAPDPDAALAMANDAVPQARFLGLTPAGPDGLVRIRLATGDILPPLTVAIDGCGAVTIDRQGVVHHLLATIHGRLLAGDVGRAVVFAAGLALPLLYVTGLLAWLRRRRHARARPA